MDRKEYNRLYYLAHREQILARKKERRKRLKVLATNRRWREANKGYFAKYYIENKERVAERSHQYYMNNRERLKTKQRERYATKIKRRREEGQTI